MEKLPGDYVAGFVDGEGCFALKFRRDIRHERKNKPVYFYWDIEFVIVLRDDDRELLEMIKNTIGCGRVSISKRCQARYAVNTLDDLLGIVVPFFDEYKLYGKKRYDFELWKEALGIIARNQQVKKGMFRSINWIEKDKKRLIGIHDDMKEYKSKRDEWKWIEQAMSKL